MLVISDLQIYVILYAMQTIQVSGKFITGPSVPESLDAVAGSLDNY